jgi:hypothetical protein
MADRGIIFSTPMVRALLEGRKTQTRRLVNAKGRTADALFNSGFSDAYIMDPGNADWRARSVTHAVGDRLYVRESIHACPDPICYRADMPGQYPDGPWRPSIHMPRWASRLTLLVTDVRVQRLQEISEADALAEGIVEHEATMTDPAEYTIGIDSLLYSSAIEAYAALWDSLHTAPGTRWEDNPWIYAVTFDVRHGNIDQIGG